ncbi:MAG: hypothetical protein HZB16_02540 [Armatimonadetes bacterium]|nr:hypothetical protein [Armatimonadota bacterium]
MGEARRVIEGVRQVGFYPDLGCQGCPEDMPFPSALAACLEYLGEDRQAGPFQSGQVFDHGGLTAHLMAVSGNSFQLCWQPGWHMDNVSLPHLTEDPDEPYRRALWAVGRPNMLVKRAADRDNAALFRRAVTESIDHGVPLLGFGVVGPPDASIITGYDDGGEVVIGWSHFQAWADATPGLAFEPDGQYRRRGWHDACEMLLLLGRAVPRPPLDEVVRETLRHAVAIMGRVSSRPVGLAAYRAWADQLRGATDVSSDDMLTLRGQFAVHDDAVGTIAETRWYAGQWLQRVLADGIGPAAPLTAAAACFDRQHDLMWRAWGLVGGNGRDDAKALAFADPAVRDALAEVIEQARDEEAAAGGHLRDALATW